MSESQTDAELNLRAIVQFGVGLTALVLAAAAVVWLFSVGLRAWERSKDPPPPLMEEARSEPAPPGPRLQIDPFTELAALRAEEETTLSTYGWVDRQQGIVRVPIERAMELMLQEAEEHHTQATEAGDSGP